MASVFDCHHGCFTPDPSEVSQIQLTSPSPKCPIPCQIGKDQFWTWDVTKFSCNCMSSNIFISLQISVEEAVSARSSEERQGFTFHNNDTSGLNLNRNESNKEDMATQFEVKEAGRGPVTPGSRGIQGLGASSHSLVPVNIPIDIEKDPIVMEILGEQPTNQRPDNMVSTNQRPDKLTNQELGEDDIMEMDRDSTGDYQEMYHTSMGHLFTVKTKDMEL